MNTRTMLFFMLLPLFAGLAGNAYGQCVTDPATGAAQFDIDHLFQGLDNDLGSDFPKWILRYQQENATDPTPNFANEDNCQNGIDDDDHLELLGAILAGEPAASVLGGVPGDRITEIRAAFAANRAKVRPDLTLVIVFISVNIIDEINKDDPAFGASLQDLVAAYMTIGDAASVQYIRGLLITLGEIFIEEGVDSGDIPGFVSGTVKNVLRSTVNNNFKATRYACYGDAPETTKPNWLGASGNISGAGESNLAAYTSAGRNRQAWLYAKGVLQPPLQIVTPPAGVTVSAGQGAALEALVAGGDGSPIGYDWKRRNDSSGTFHQVSVSPQLAFLYALPSDNGAYSLYVCDDTWIRAAQPAQLTVNTAPFQFVVRPSGAEKFEGENHTFSVRVSGGEVLPQYRWYRGPNASALTEIPGATEPDLTLGPLQISDTGVYQARVTGGSATSPSTLNTPVVVLAVDPAPDTTPPVITLNGDSPLYVECGSVYAEPGASAWDAVSGDVTATLVISGVVNTASPGEYLVTYTARDNAGNVAESARTVIVADATPPELTLIGPDPLVLACGTVFVDPGAAAMDACSGNITGLIVAQGLVDAQSPGAYTRTYTVEDLARNPAQITRTVIVSDNEAPALTLLGDTLITVECGNAFTDPGATATDTCDGDLSTAIEVSGAVNTATPGDYPITYTVRDGAGNNAQTTRTVRVLDTTGPALTLLGDTLITVECGSGFTDPGATATDACDGDVSAAIEVSGAVNTSAPGDYPITYTVRDGAGNTAQTTRTVRVVDTTAPTLTLLGDTLITVECGSVFTEPGATATDACDGDVSTAIEVSGAANTSAPGDYPITYTARDGAGNNAQTTRTVRVVDTTGPALTLLGDTLITVECGNAFTDPGATTTDACDGDVSTAIEVSGAVNTAMPGDYTITYTTRDGAGNTVQTTRTVRVLDSAAPVITLLGDALITIECGSVFTDPGATAVDGCGGEALDSIEIMGSVNVNVPGDYTLTYSAQDALENSAETTRTVRVVDTTAPVITLLGANPLTLSCNGVYVEPGATAQDTCDGDRSAWIEISGGPQAGAPGTYSVTYSVADAAGNPRAVTRTVVVLDDCDILITRQPQRLAVYTGMRAVFDVAAQGGVGALTFQWRKDGVPIDDARQARLMIHAVALEDAGAYDCLINDDASAVVSAAASLTVFERPESGQHSADTNSDWSISLSEALRLIQFYNIGSFFCADGTEDGYLPGSGPRDCAPHDSDYNPQDWAVGLEELLRLVQFFNMPGGLYHRAEDTEDRFAPGAG